MLLFAHNCANPISEIQEIFSLFDKDGDGSVSTQYLAPLLRAAGFNPSEQEVQKIIDEVDTDGKEIFFGMIIERKIV